MGFGNKIAVTRRYQYAKRRFYERNAKFNYFNDITAERKDEIKNNANTWLEIHNKEDHMELLLCLFNNLNDPTINSRITGNKKSDIFDFQNTDEEIMFYLFVGDPELKLLKICFEESKMQNIKTRYHEEFGIILDDYLLKLELLYNKKFPTIIDEFNNELTLTKEKKNH